MKDKILNTARVIKRYILKEKNYFRWVLSKEIYKYDEEKAFEELSQIAPSPGTSAVTNNNIKSSVYDLTIIIPAYNSEKWLNECLDSVINQKTKYSYQIIAVDDGSNDNTASILDSYAGNEHMLILHQENKGHSGARNSALKLVQSKYIMFVDSDDILLSGAIEKLMSVAFNENADIVEGNGYRFNEEGRLGLVKPKERENTVWGGPCLKIIRARLMEHIEFPMGYLYEDTIINSLLVPLAKIVKFIPDEIYGYRIHSASITQNHTANLNRTHSYWIMLQMFKDMEKLCIEKNYDSYLRVLSHIVFTYRRCVLLPDNVKKLIFICTRKFLVENYREYLGTKNAYCKLTDAILKYQYGKYCVICETI